MALIDIKVPDIGDFKEVAVIELLVQPGDTVKVEQSLITVESDKASMEIPSSTAGVVKELKVALGDKVKEGSVVLVLEAVLVLPPLPPLPPPPLMVMLCGCLSHTRLTTKQSRTEAPTPPGPAGQGPQAPLMRWSKRQLPGSC